MLPVRKPSNFALLFQIGAHVSFREQTTEQTLAPAQPMGPLLPAPHGPLVHPVSHGGAVQGHAPGAKLWTSCP